MKRFFLRFYGTLCMSIFSVLAVSCFDLGGENEESNSPNQSVSGDVVEKNYVEIMSDPEEWVHNKVVVSFNETTYKLVVASRSNEYDNFIPEEHDGMMIEMRRKDTIVAGWNYIYDLIFTIPANETGEDRFISAPMSLREFGIYFNIVQPAKIIIESDVKQIKVPAVGAIVENAFVNSTFSNSNILVEMFEEVYYTNNNGAIEQLPEQIEVGEFTVWSALKVAPNPKTAERRFRIYYGIKNRENGEVEELYNYEVVQSGEPYITSESSLSVDSGSQKIEVKVNTNVNVQYNVSDKWLGFVEVKNGKYIFNASENNGADLRSATISFSDGNGVTTTVNVVQYGSKTVKVHLNYGESLESKLSLEQMVSIESLVITGNMREEDYYPLTSYFTTLRYLDISGIEENTESHLYGEFISMPSYAFANMKQLEVVILPENIREIPVGAFMGCSVLRSVNIPYNVVSIGSEAFDKCVSLKQIDIPASVQEFGFASFWGCTSLESIKIPYGVTILPCSIFFECTSLKRIELPNSITEFKAFMDGGRSGSQFALCSSLEYVNIPETVTELPMHTFLYCEKLKSVDLSNIKKIGDAAFLGAKELQSIKLSSDLKSIDDSAFGDCISIKSVELPLGMTFLGYGVFQGCTALESINVPATLKAVPEYFCAECTSLTSIELPNSIVEIGMGAFEGCPFTSIQLPSGLQHIRSGAFEDNKLTEITLPATLKTIGSNAFSNNPLESLVIPEGVTTIGSHAFYNTKIKELRIPESVTELGSWCFADNNLLKKVIILANITTIPERAFYNCPDMFELQLPKNLTRAEEDAFLACQQVRYIYSEATTPPNGPGFHPLIWAFIRVYLPTTDMVELYRGVGSDGWWEESARLMTIHEDNMEFDEHGFEPTYYWL